MTRFGIMAALMAAGMALTACNGTLEDIAPKSERQLPQSILNTMQARGMSRTSPIMVRIFKEESVLEVWKQRDSGRYDMIASYEICRWSGKLGPKFTEGDRQAPEGFYSVGPHQMNPNSSYHLSFNLGFPNAYDRVHGRSGQHLMVHGACSSAGCYSMTDEQVEQIYAFARDAFRGGQTAFQVQAFPFRMTAANMARYRNDPNFEFWTMLKEGYDHFEITKTPPKVDVCEKRYVFNRFAAEGQRFDAAGACPSTTRPQSLETAYSGYQGTYDSAFRTAAEGRSSAPAPTIAGLKEAALVADWSRRRARGESVSREPPSLGQAVAAAPQTPAAEPVLPAAAAVAVPTPSPAPEAAQQATAPAVTEAPVAETAAAPAPAPAAQPSEGRWGVGRLMGMFSR